MQQWKEVPADWIFTEDPWHINGEIRANMARYGLTHNDVAEIIGIKRQALARRLHGETPWRWSEIRKLDAACLTALYEILKNPEDDTNTANHP